jgi:hypothetical protein
MCPDLLMPSSARAEVLHVPARRLANVTVVIFEEYHLSVSTAYKTVLEIRNVDFDVIGCLRT